MHELSLVEELVSECSRLAEGRAVLEVYVHCAEGTDADEVAECFEFLSSRGSGGGPQGIMARARLRMVKVPARGSCSCGFSGDLGPQSVAGHMFVCPDCGRVGEQPAALELMAMTFARS